MKTLAPILALLLAGCGNEPASTTPPQPTETPQAAPAPSSTPEPAASAEPTASASASAKAKPPAEAKPQSSGRPAVLKADPNEITDTFGFSPASKLELGDKDIATLRLPEGGLHTATLVTFKIEKTAKSTGGLVGKIYSIKAVVPPSANAEQIESGGPPFVLELPSGVAKEANLAIGVEDDKGKVKWSIVAAKRMDDSRKVAVFELTTLPSAFLHVTTKAPTGGK